MSSPLLYCRLPPQSQHLTQIQSAFRGELQGSSNRKPWEGKLQQLKDFATGGRPAAVLRRAGSFEKN